MIPCGCLIDRTRVLAACGLVVLAPHLGCVEQRQLGSVVLSIREAAGVDGALDRADIVDINYQPTDGTRGNGFSRTRGKSLANDALAIDVAGLSATFTVATTGGDIADTFGRSAVVNVPPLVDEPVVFEVPVILGARDAVTLLTGAPPARSDYGVCSDESGRTFIVAGLGAGQSGSVWNPTTRVLDDLDGALGRGRASCVADGETAIVYGGCDGAGSPVVDSVLVRVGDNEPARLIDDAAVGGSVCGGIVRRAGEDLWLVAGSTLHLFELDTQVVRERFTLPEPRFFADAAVTAEGALLLVGGVDGVGQPVPGSVVVEKDGSIHEFVAGVRAAQRGSEALLLRSTSVVRVGSDGGQSHVVDCDLTNLDVEAFVLDDDNSVFLLADEGGTSSLHVQRAGKGRVEVPGLAGRRTHLILYPGGSLLLAGSGDGIDIATLADL